MADVYAPIRAGTDIAFLGGIIRHILENDLWFRDYVVHYTNIATIIEDGFRSATEGLFFSGWDEDKRKYTNESWQYRGEEVPSSLAEHNVHTTDALRRRPGNEDVSRTLTDVNAIISEVMGGHYAIDGVQWKSIEEARNALGALAPRASRSGHTPNAAPPPAGVSG